jgi:hypothetical protein
MALMLSIFANTRCHFVDIKDPQLVFGSNRDFVFPTPPQSVGLWCYESITGNNIDAQDIKGDSKYDMARSMGLTVMIFGWFIFVFYAVAGCKRFPPKAFRFIGLSGILNCLFQGLTFLLLQSSLCDEIDGMGGCEIGTGAKCAISACVFWFLTGTTSCACGKEMEEETSTEQFRS